jgi:hypothetical protein
MNGPVSDRAIHHVLHEHFRCGDRI